MPIDFRHLGGGGGGGGGGGADISTLAINALAPTYNTPIDGVSSAMTQVQAIHDACAGKESYFPAGTYLFTGTGLLIRSTGSVHRGAGMWATMFKADVAMSYMMQPGGAASDVVFEDIAFIGQPGQPFGEACNFNGNFGARITFRRCRFHNFSQALAFIATDGVTVEDCLFTNPGTAKGDGIATSGECRNIHIRRNTFWYVRSAILCSGAGVGSGTQITDTVEIEGNYFDLGWWLLVPLGSGGGATVSYTATVLTDTSQSFTTLLPNAASYIYFVRAMATRRTGTGAGVSYPYGTNSLVDTGANFLTAGILKGEIVRSGTRFGVVSVVESATVLYVEQWLTDLDRTPAQKPTDGDTYTVFGVYLGQVLSRTATTVTTSGFYDLTGLRLTPTATTYYELTEHSSYGLNCESGVRNVRVISDTFRRGWSDQCSIFGDRFQIIGNYIEYGQDMGITVQPPLQSTGYSVISGNRIHHQGTGSIFLAGSFCQVTGNVLTETTWTTTDPNTVAGIMCAQVGNSITSNIIDGNGNPQSRIGICVFSNDVNFPATNNMIVNNELRGHLFADIRLLLIGGGTMTGTHIDFNRTYSSTKINTGALTAGVNYDINQPEDGLSVAPLQGYGFNGNPGTSGGIFMSGTTLIFRSGGAGAGIIMQDSVGAAATITCGAVGFNGNAAVGKAAHPATLADVIAIVTNVGLSA